MKKETSNEIVCFKEYAIGGQFPFPALRQYQVTIHEEYYKDVRDKLKMLKLSDKTESFEIKIEVNQIQNRIIMYCFLLCKNYEYHIQKLGMEIAKYLPALKYLRIIFKVPFHNNKNCFTFVQHINQLQNLIELEIISQTDPTKDKDPNWTHSLKIRPILKKFVTIAKVTLYDEKRTIDKLTLKEMQKTEEQHSYKTQLSSKSLNEAHKIKKWNCSFLELYIQTATNPINSIKNIEFKHLKILSLYRTQMETLESLARLKAPLLQDLSIRENNISCLESLKKLSSRNLKRCSVSKNHINQGKHLSLLDWNDLQSFDIESLNTEKDQFMSIKFMCKLNFKKSSFEIQSSHRIQEKIVAEKLAEKGKELVINSSFGSFTTKIR